MYVGKADCLRDRVWKNHSGRWAARPVRAAAQHPDELLGIASSAHVKARRYQPTSDEVLAVRALLDACNNAWVECETNAAAKALEDNM